MKNDDIKWILCPVCGNKTRNIMRRDTVLKNFPLFCPKCKRESLVEVCDWHTKVIDDRNDLLNIRKEN